MKRVIISGGGTGGHIFPALSIAQALKRLAPDTDILFVGAEGRMEMEKVPEAGFPIVGLPVQGFRRKLTLANIRVLFDLWRSLRRARKIVASFAPDVVVGVGGYASGPIGRVAAKRGVPLVLQEQNSYAGVTNRLLAKKAARICVAYTGMERFFPAGRIVLTGNPVRASLLESAGDRLAGIAFYGLDAARKTVLVTGGSLGAGTINRAVREMMERLAGWNDVQLIWQCGSYYYPELEKELAGRLPEQVKLLPFLQRMDLAYACADLVVSRAGAATISELSLLGKPAILVPSPNVSEDHQTKNARALVEKEAALLIPDAQVSGTLGDTLERLLHDPESLESLSAHILRLGLPDSDLLIAQTILAL